MEAESSGTLGLLMGWERTSISSTSEALLTWRESVPAIAGSVGALRGTPERTGLGGELRPFVRDALNAEPAAGLLRLGASELWPVR